MEIRKNDRIVFFGDSITEWGRDKAEPSKSRNWLCELSSS